MACVNINSKEFKDTANRLNIDSGELELIVHKFINLGEKNLDAFPSDLYILELLTPNTFEASSELLELFFKARHDIPIQFNNINDFNSSLQELKRYYPEDAIKGYKNSNGLYTIQIATPKVNGIPLVLDNSMVDSLLRRSNQNKPHQLLFKAALATIGKDNVKIKMQKTAPTRSDGIKAYADYNPFTDTITFYVDSILEHKKNLNLSEEEVTSYLAQTLTHELLHLLTYKTLHSPVTEAAEQFSKEINELYNTALDYFKDDKSALYGLTSVDEFISEAFSNPDFLLELAKIKTHKEGKQKSLWLKFTEILSNYFKQRFGIDISNTLLEDTISSILNFIDYVKPSEELALKDLEEQNKLYDEAFELLYEDITPASYSELHEALRAFRGDWGRSSYKGFVTNRFENTRGKWRIIIPESFRGTVAEARDIAKEMLASKGATGEMYSLGRDFDRITDNGITYTTLRVGFKSDKRDQKNTVKVKDKIKVPKSKMTPEERARQDTIDLLLEVRPDLKDRIENGLIDVDYLINNPDEITTLASAFESPNEIKDEYNIAELIDQWSNEHDNSIYEDMMAWGEDHSDTIIPGLWEENRKLREQEVKMRNLELNANAIKDIEQSHIDRLNYINDKIIAWGLRKFPRADHKVIRTYLENALERGDGYTIREGGIPSNAEPGYVYRGYIQTLEAAKEAIENEFGAYNEIPEGEDKKVLEGLNFLLNNKDIILKGILNAYVSLTPNSHLEEVLRLSLDTPIEGITYDGIDISDYLNYQRNVIQSNDESKKLLSKQLSLFDDYKIAPVKIKGLSTLENQLDILNEPTTIQNDEVNAYLTGYTLHSGGAEGSDITWGKIGEEFGLKNANHYYTGQKSGMNAPHGNKEISTLDYEEGRSEAAKAAQRNWGYSYPYMKDSRLIRNWAQVKYADAIFAVGTIVHPGERIFPNQKNDTRTAVTPSVTGGTGYAVGMAILHDKPVYVFDLNTEQWYTWDSEVGDFIETDTPILTENFAGIGTREINDAGRKAIRDVYAKTTQALYDEAMSAPFRELLELDNTLKLMEEDFTITRGENGGIQRIEVNKDNILANQVIEHLKSIGIEVHSRDEMLLYLKDNNYTSLLEYIDDINSQYTPEMQDILKNAPRNDEGQLLVYPGGPVSNLDTRQYAHVRTKAFKEWFGDWENPYIYEDSYYDVYAEPESLLDATHVSIEEGGKYYLEDVHSKVRTEVSKQDFDRFNKGLRVKIGKEKYQKETRVASYIVDENGEPLVMHHRTKTNNINEFKLSESRHGGFWFSKDKNYYIKEEEDSNFNDIAVFLNIRHPNTVRHEEFLNAIDGDVSIEGGLTTNDGWITLETKDPGWQMYEDEYTPPQIIFAMATHPNQIKSATDNVGTYSKESNNIQEFTTENGEVYGFVTPEGLIYLDENVINEEHPIHEYTHLWDRAVKNSNLTLWMKGVELMQATSLWNEIANSEQYGKKWANQRLSREERSDLIASEVHARLVGKDGALLLRDLAEELGKTGIIDKLKKWLTDFWKELKSTFGVWNKEEINKLTLEEFNAMTLRDFAEGTPLKNITSDISKRELQRESTAQREIVNNNQDAFLLRSLLITEQVNNLRESSSLTNSEISEIAEDVVYWISDFITDLQRNTETVLDSLQEAGVNVDHLRGEDFANMARADVVKKLGVKILLDRAKELFDPERNTENEYYKDYDVKELMWDVMDNFEGLMEIAQPIFLTTEKFSIKYNDLGLAEVNDDLSDSINATDFNNTNEEEDIKELEANEAEHWMIESRTRDIMEDMQKAVENALLQCFILDENSNRVKSKRGIDRRINRRQATNSIVRWTQGALTLSDMIIKLLEKLGQHPWVSLLISKLQDLSGEYNDLQSQFFSDFYKPFLLYSVVKYEKGKYKSMPVNEHKALTEATNLIKAQYNTGKHPLFTSEGINKKTFKDLLDAYNEIKEITSNKDIDWTNEETINKLAHNLAFAANSLGYYTIPELVKNSITENNVKVMQDALRWIDKSLSENLNNKAYEPFTFKAKGSIDNNVKQFLGPLTESLEDIAISSFFDSGKMYLSYITPSYMAKLMQKFKLTGESYQQFIENEFKKYDWFYDKTKGEWLNDWILQLATDEKAKEIFAHKTLLNFNKKNYMKDMDDMEYTLSLISEYFAESENETQSKVPAWFRIPMMSNKPSSEFIRFYSYRGITYKENITSGLKNIFDLELKRIQTVTLRNRSKTDPDFIKNWDTNGKKFNFLTFMNEYLKENPSKELEFSSLLKRKIKGEALKPGEENTLYTAAKRIIKEEMENKAKQTVDNWESLGILEAAKKITGIGKSPAEIRENLENFVWNDYYAAMNIMELTITDIANYKNAEDLQKRLAQIHSPGIRGNAEAVLYNSFKEKYGGDKVTDGFTRTFYLRDFEDFKSNIIENVGIVFDKKIAEARLKGNETEAKGLEALKESLVGENGAYRQINVTDAQGYCSPTAYMKKATIFGKWSEERQRIYDRLKKGEASYAEIKEAFLPLKPFVYSQIEKSVNTTGAPMLNIKMGVQNKNSEYLLILADAITLGYNTGRPNLLRAIYQVMEESHFDRNGKYKTDGIDTVLFESTVKTGLTGVIDINKYISLKPFTMASNGEMQAKRVMEACIYRTEQYRPTRLEVNKETNEFEEVVSDTALSNRVSYNSTFVHAIPVEDYSIQLETPEHFKKHSQAHGSQGRYIIPSELSEFDAFGNEILYNVKNVVTNADGSTEVLNEKVNAKTFKERYERNIAENIEESILLVREELGLSPNISIKDRNTAISKVLQREILSSPRYGVDLLLACSVDENGQFRIPLGDPILSKRIEQLLTSIIKNRVNKLKIAGGPVVQVSNFGTSRELNIRFKDKNGGILKTRKEFEGTDKEFKKYILENQSGIAYFEVFAPIYSDELLKFTDGLGNIDIDMIELVNPDLLKMVGYRIPTEAKYSMAPLKIVGFLPREAGEGIMLPNDITLLTGSDFDIDKEYLMRKEFDIAWRFEPTGKNPEEMVEAEKDWVEHNRKSLTQHLIKSINLTAKVNKTEYNQIEKDANAIAEVDTRTEERLHKKNLEDIEDKFTQLEEVEENVKYRKDNEEKNKEIQNNRIIRQDKEYNRAIKRENKRHTIRLAKIQKEKDEYINNKVKILERNKVRNRVEHFLKVDRNLPTKMDDKLTRELRKAYLDFKVKVIEPTSGRTFRNNQIVDMTYEVLTHELSAAEMLNPGGFEPQKRMGYLVAAYRDPNNTKTWLQLKTMTTDELKDLCQVDKNLMDINTHIQFYKQNSAAGSLIGIFAVERVAHAVIENEGYRMDIFKACGIDKAFKVMGQVFGGYERIDLDKKVPYIVDTGVMEIDVRLNNNGESVGKVLGSLVASAADAVKDPVLNLMNINSQTANILNTLVRLGVPFEDAALFLSSAAISNVLKTLSRKNLSGFTTFNDVINSRIKEIETSLGLTKDSVIHSEELTKEELIKSIKEKDMTLSIEYKVLLALKKFKAMGEAMRLPTFATRFNSISNATGPLAVDNLMVEYKMRKLSADSSILDKYNDNNYISMWDIVLKHPILDKFVDSFAVARELLGNQGGVTANSTSFRNFLFTLETDEINGNLYDKIMRDRKLLSGLSDFYLSYLLVLSGVIDANDLLYYITEFPTEFLNKDYKEKYKDNLLIQSIKFGNDKSNRLTLEINLTGVDTRDKEKIGDAWSDLYKQDKELAIQLFKYCFFRGGIGFNPKSFMALLPLQMKEAIPNYINTFRLLPSVTASYVFDQFIRNNWDSGKLVPSLDNKGDNIKITDAGNGLFKVKMKQNGDLFKLAKTTYFKIRVKEENTEIDKMYALENIVEGEGKEPPTTFFREVEPLGSNKDYIELSTENIVKATDTTMKVEEEELPLGMQDTEVTEEPPHIYDEVPFPEETPIQTDSLTELNENEDYYRDLAYQAFLASPSIKVSNSARETVDTWKNKSDREKKSLARSTKNFFKLMFDRLKILYDEALVDKVYESIC